MENSTGYEIEEAEKLFQKKFSFESNSNFILPDLVHLFSTDHWQLDQFITLKTELNDTKNLLNDKEIKEWRRHTTYTNPAGSVLNAVRCEINSELLTQAWLKFYEIVSSYPLVPSNVASFSTFHLCEAPGAFVAALNHYLACKNRRIKWKWMANTLNPYYEGNSAGTAIMDDRFLIQTLSNWYFGSDDTGNILNSTYLPDLLNYLKINGNNSHNLIDLVTADGSIDCQENPSEQENLVASLNFAEVTIALHLLKCEGNFVLKMFTSYECNAICVLYLLNCVFHEVNVFKPATSKSGNSEVYVICLNYKRQLAEPLLKILRENIGYQLSQKCMFSINDIPENFSNQLYNCCNKFKIYQEKTILENLHYFKEMTPEECHHLNLIKESCADMYLTKYKLNQIKKFQRILNMKKYKQHISKSKVFSSDIIQKVQRSGSFNSRKEQEQNQQVNIKKQLSEWFCFPESYNEIISIKVEFKTIEPYLFWIKKGLPCSYITNSKFCFPHLLPLCREFKNIQVENNASFDNVYNWEKVKENQEFKDVLSKIHVVINMCNSHFALLKELKTILPCSVNTVCYDEKIQFLEGPKLVYFDIFCCTKLLCPLQEESKFKKCLINQCIKIISVLNENDCFVLSLQGSLTRITNGILYLLMHLFSEVLILSPKIDADVNVNQLWIFSTHQLENKKRILRYLNHIRDEIEIDSKIVEIVPILFLCEDPFYTCILKSNQMFLTRRLHKIIN